MFIYVQRTGHLYTDSGKILGNGYSGRGPGLNNPHMQNVRAVGPAPCGSYTIDPARTPVDHLGPLAMPLEPDPKNQMFGRSEFFIHGDNASGNHSASDGCIILPHATRQQIDNSSDDVLVVVAEETDVPGALNG